jgi:hypothetical protein
MFSVQGLLSAAQQRVQDGAESGIRSSLVVVRHAALAHFSVIAPHPSGSRGVHTVWDEWAYTALAAVGAQRQAPYAAVHLQPTNALLNPVQRTKAAAERAALEAPGLAAQLHQAAEGSARWLLLSGAVLHAKAAQRLWEVRLTAFHSSDRHAAAAAATAVRLGMCHRKELFEVGMARKEMYDTQAALEQVRY